MKNNTSQLYYSVKYAIFDEDFNLYSPIKTISGGNGAVMAQLIPGKVNEDGSVELPNIWVMTTGSNSSMTIKEYNLDGVEQRTLTIPKSNMYSSVMYTNPLDRDAYSYGIAYTSSSKRSQYAYNRQGTVNNSAMYGRDVGFSPKYIAVSPDSSDYTDSVYIMDAKTVQHLRSWKLSGSDGDISIVHPKFDIMLCGISFGWGGTRSYESVDLNTATKLGEKSLNTNGITVPIYKEGTNYAWLGKDGSNNGLVMDKNLNVLKTVPNGDYIGSTMGGGNICLPDDNGGCWVLGVGSSNAAGFNSRVQHINNDCKIDKTITLPTELQSLYNSTDIGSSAIEFTMLVENKEK